jgi:hypothetical protein
MSEPLNCQTNREILTDSRYMMRLDFKAIENNYSVGMKELHTIIEKWPLALKLQHGEEGAKEEFEMKLAAGSSGQRYVEWARIKQ